MLALLAAALALVQEPAPAAVTFELSLKQEPELSLEVLVKTTGSPDGRTVYEVSDEWGGVKVGGEDLVPVGVWGGQGQALELERPEPHRLLVLHEPGESVALRYRIPINAHQASSDPGTFRRPIVTDSLFHAVGTLFLFVPEHLDGAARRVLRFRWRHFDRVGWRVATSFGVAPEDGFILVNDTLDRARHAMYLAGELRLFEVDVRRSPLVIALTGERWGFEDDQLVHLAGSIVEAERAFFDDLEREFYLISLIPVGPELGPGSQSMGGTGLTNCFSLTMHPNAQLEPVRPAGLGVAGLLAHEMFHEWNGQVIHRVEPEQLVYWFSEGFTNFYARRLLLRCGLIDVERYAASVNDALQKYLTSPVVGEPNARILADFWNDADVKDLPYLRGDLVAMLVDRSIRRASGGRRSLDDLMRELADEARATGQRIDTELLLERFAQHGDAGTADFVRRVIVDGETAPVPADLFGEALELTWVEQPTYELGFDFDGSLEAKRVQGVIPGSAAHAAGLRDGLGLVGWSVQRGELEREVRLDVLEDGVPRSVRYRPHGPARTLPRFVPRPGADPSAL